MRLLLLSNSTNAGESYLNYAKTHIKNFLGEKSLKALFIPFAGVTIDYDSYSFLKRMIPPLKWVMKMTLVFCKSHNIIVI